MRLLKWFGIVLSGLALILVVAIAVLYFLAERNLNRTHTLAFTPVEIPADAEAVARGKHIVHAVASCVSCHGPALEGQVFIDGMPIGVVVASNLTTGAGGVGSVYEDQDWVAALRYGVGADGKALLPMMPSDSYHALSDEDLGAVIAYLQSLPPVDSEAPLTALAFTGKIIMGVLSQGDFPANYLSTSDPSTATTPTGATIEHGTYLVSVGSCRHCHGDALSGGQVDPESLPGPNLTPGGDLGEWAEADFINAIRTGLRPNGSQINPFMPWPHYRDMTDDELTSIWLYLHALEPAESTMPSGM